MIKLKIANLYKGKGNNSNKTEKSPKGALLKNDVDYHSRIVD
jgi:hypothetical protein